MFESLRLLISHGKCLLDASTGYTYMYWYTVGASGVYASTAGYLVYALAECRQIGCTQPLQHHRLLMTMMPFTASSRSSIVDDRMSSTVKAATE